MGFSLLSLIPSVLKGAKGLATAFVGDKEKRDQYAAQENQAGLAQYAAEFHQRASRTWFDSFVDCFNRGMRPTAFYGLFGMLAYSAYDPVGATIAYIALSNAPELLFVMFASVLVFLFPSRLVEKKWMKESMHSFRNMNVDKALETARKIKELRQDLRAEKQEHDTSAMPNETITRWKEGRG